MCFLTSWNLRKDRNCWLKLCSGVCSSIHFRFECFFLAYRENRNWVTLWKSNICGNQLSFWSDQIVFIFLSRFLKKSSRVEIIKKSICHVREQKKCRQKSFIRHKLQNSTFLRSKKLKEKSSRETNTFEVERKSISSRYRKLTCSMTDESSTRFALNGWRFRCEWEESFYHSSILRTAQLFSRKTPPDNSERQCDKELCHAHVLTSNFFHSPRSRLGLSVEEFFSRNKLFHKTKVFFLLSQFSW